MVVTNIRQSEEIAQLRAENKQLSTEIARLRHELESAEEKSRCGVSFSS